MTATADAGAATATPAGRRARSITRMASVVAGVAVLLGLVLLAASVGASGVGPGDALDVAWSRLLGRDLSAAQLRTQTLVWELRMPRIALALAAGAGLAIAGVVLQGLLRNPLVSPFTLGISSAAAFGASLALLADVTLLGRRDVAVVAGALLAATACAALAVGLAGRRGAGPETLILVGMALTYLFGALTATVQYVASDEQLAEIVRWTFGSVNGATRGEALVVGLAVVLAVPILLWRSADLDAVAFAGDDVAASLGVDVRRLRAWATLLAVLLAAVVVSFTGVIGFVGLVAPHIARLLIGTDHRHLLPFSALTGAALLLAADTAGRTVLSPAVIPVGIVVSFIGAPLFLHLVLRRRASR